MKKILYIISNNRPSATSPDLNDVSKYNTNDLFLLHMLFKFSEHNHPATPYRPR